MNLVNMKNAPETVESGQPVGAEYPYGLEVSIDNKNLAKLGLLGLPPVGTVVMLTALAKVCSTSSRESEDDGVSKCVTLQITDMALTRPGDDENMAARLWPRES